MTPCGGAREAYSALLAHYGLGLSEEVIQANLPALSEILEDYIRCGACPGRDRCASEGLARVPRFPYGPERIVVCFAPCKLDGPYRQAKRIERLMRSSRLPAGFREKTFESFQVTPGTREAYDLARKVAENAEARGLLLAGPPGVGKTHLAAAIVNARLASGRQALFCMVPEMLGDIRRVIRDDDATCELMDLVKEAELLVLDDLGAERATEWAREVMLIIVSARLAADRQTVVTTNYATAGELIERFGGGQEGMRIVSRLFGLCMPVRLEGPDWRLYLQTSHAAETAPAKANEPERVNGLEPRLQHPWA